MVGRVFDRRRVLVRKLVGSFMSMKLAFIPKPTECKWAVRDSMTTDEVFNAPFYIPDVGAVSKRESE